MFSHSFWVALSLKTFLDFPSHRALLIATYLASLGSKTMGASITFKVYHLSSSPSLRLFMLTECLSVRFEFWMTRNSV